jgi:hypothetical protein
MCTQVQYRPFVDLGGLVFGGVDLRIVLYEVAYALDEVAALFLLLEVLLF